MIKLRSTVRLAWYNEPEILTMRSQRDTGRGWAIRATLRPLSIALITVAMSFAGVAVAYASEIVNVASGLRADVIGASTSRFQGLFLWPNNTSTSQEFDVYHFSEKDYYHIKAKQSGQCLMLDWREGQFKNGTKVIQYPACNDSGYGPSQWYSRFVLDDCNPAWQQCNLPQRRVIVNVYTGKCLDAGNSRGGAPGQGAVLQQWDCITSIHQWNAGNQLWDFQ